MLPKGVSAGPIQWPTPDKFNALGSIGYGYHDKTILLVPMVPSLPTLAPGQATISGNVSWLECKESCIPRDQQVSATADDRRDRHALGRMQLKLDAAKTETAKKRCQLGRQGVVGWRGQGR